MVRPRKLHPGLTDRNAIHIAESSDGLQNDQTRPGSEKSGPAFTDDLIGSGSTTSSRDAHADPG